MVCNQCGRKWQKDVLPDLRRRPQVTWARWNFGGAGHRWPKKSYKDALLEAPPGLTGGQTKKKARKEKETGMQKG